MRTCEAPVRRCVQSFTRWQKDPKVFRRTRYAGFRRKRRPDIIPLNLQDSGFALRGSSASCAGASIARGCPPRTSPPPAADLRAEARTHLPRRKVRFARNALRELASLVPLSCS